MTTPNPLPTLAELVAKVRHAKRPKTEQLEPHREELLRLRRAGDSVEVLAIALRGLGVDISTEALRLWLNRELGHKPVRRRKVRLKFGRLAVDPSAPADSPAARNGATLPSTVASATGCRTDHPPGPTDAVPVKPSWVILPGETPEQALNRQFAAMRAARKERRDAN